MKKICVVTLYEYDDYHDDHITGILEKNITEWVEMSDEEVEIMRKGIRGLNVNRWNTKEYHILISKEDTSKNEIYLKTVNDFKLKIEQERLKEEKRIAAEKEKKLLKKLKLEANTLQSKKELLEKLKKELGED